MGAIQYLQFFRAHFNYIFTPQKLQEHTKLRRVAHIEFSVAMIFSPSYIELVQGELKVHVARFKRQTSKLALIAYK